MRVSPTGDDGKASRIGASLLPAMQKVVGSSPIIRSSFLQNNACGCLFGRQFPQKIIEGERP
jgi:hypothetical protein